MSISIIDFANQMYQIRRPQVEQNLSHAEDNASLISSMALITIAVLAAEILMIVSKIHRNSTTNT